MYECKECFHYDVCCKLIGKDKIDRVSWMCHFPDQCSEFKNRTNCAEVIHAHWEDGYAVHNGKEVYKSIDCSHCNDIFKIESEDREYWKERFKVCPFCGAVMDEVDGNG